MTQVQLAFVMPAYNEEACIEKVVSAWLGAMAKTGLANEVCKLVVVNDGSKDRTGEILDRAAAKEPRLQVIHQKNGGHGAALLILMDYIALLSFTVR